MPQTIRTYENTTDQDILVTGVGVIKAHDRLTERAEFHAPVNLANFPGIIDVLEHEANGNQIRAVNPADHTEYTPEEQAAELADAETSAKIAASREAALASAAAATAPQAPVTPTAKVDVSANAAPAGQLETNKEGK